MNKKLREKNGMLVIAKCFFTGLFVMFVGAVAHADIEGGRIKVGLASFMVERPDNAEALELVFGSSGAFRQFVERLSTLPSRRNVTYVLLHTGKEGDAQQFILSSRIARPKPLEQDVVIAASSAQELAQKLCELTSLCLATRLPAKDRPSVLQPPLAPTRAGLKGQIQLEVGEFPTSRPPLELDRKNRPPPGVGAASADIFNLGDLIERRAKEREVRDTQEVERAPLPPPGAAAAAIAPTPRLIAVHCTAFNTSIPAAKAWVQRLRQEKKLNKSHGVILTDGTYLEIWPFEERKVWATKVETCAETTRRAMGAIINIELHYYCGYKGLDKTMVVRATDAQYLTLGKVIDGLVAKFGPMRVLSHKEIDRGLKDGHVDPLGFEFAKLAKSLSQETTAKVTMITDVRQEITSDNRWSNYWPPQFSGTPDLETNREDDCKRDHR
jgi:N-acetylmuramoyl-L-alanine amidase